MHDNDDMCNIGDVSSLHLKQMGEVNKNNHNRDSEVFKSYDKVDVDSDDEDIIQLAMKNYA